MTVEDFGVGNMVNVDQIEGDQFTHDFTGWVRGFHDGYVVVEDLDGDCWDCAPSQLSFCSDEHM